MQNIQEIIRIIDQNKHNLSDKDYIDICSNLQNIYDKNENTYDFDDDYLDTNSNVMIIFGVILMAIYLIIQSYFAIYGICSKFLLFGYNLIHQ
jgi:hypothetical protein